MIPAAILLGIAIQTVPAQTRTVPVLSQCDTSSTVIAQAPADAEMKVSFSIAGAPTCYLVTVAINGRSVRGYVFDSRADAIANFEKSRVQTEVVAFRAPIFVPAPEPPAAAPKASVAATAAAKPDDKKPAAKKPPKVAF